MAIFEVAILMPVYNEKGTIKKVVKSCLKFGNLIVVNDFSNDGSEKILKKIKSKNFFLINNKNNIGYEKSINKAFLRAKKKNFKYIVTFDADNQFYIKDLKKTIAYLKNGYEIVIGNRIILQRSSEYLLSFFSNLIYKIKDPMSGLKGYSRKIFKKYKYFDTQNLSGTELLFNSLSKQVKLKQFKIKTKKRKGLSKFGNNFFTNFYILKSLIFLLKHFFVLKEEGKQ